MLDVKKLLTKITSALTWKYLGSQTGSTAINIPSGWKELIVSVGKDGSYTQYYVVETGTYVNGRFASNNGQQGITVTSSSVAVNSFYVGTTNNLSSATIKAWYR